LELGFESERHPAKSASEVDAEEMLPEYELKLRRVRQKEHVTMSLSEEDKRWVLEQLAENAQRLEGRLRATRSDLPAAVERVETNLLTEFYTWASPIDARKRTHTAVLRAVEVEALSDRVTKLEATS